MKFEFGRGDLPEWALDQIHTHVDLHFGWQDRLRVLVQGRCHVHVKTDVEYAPGRLQVVSTVGFPSVRWPWRRRMELGMVEAPREGGSTEIQQKTSIRRDQQR